VFAIVLAAIVIAIALSRIGKPTLDPSQPAPTGATTKEQ
jgi:hypothetical protein